MDVPAGHDSAAMAGAALQRFSVKDSVLEPATLVAVNNYLHDGGSPEDAIDALANGYEGTADMVNLVSKWVREAGGDPEELTEKTVTGLLNTEFQTRSADMAYRGYVQSDEPTPSFLDEVARSEKWGSVARRITSKDQKSPLQFFFRQRATMADGDVEWAISPEGTITSLRRAIEGLSSKDVVTETDLRAFYDDVARCATYDELTFVLTLRVLADTTKVCSDLGMKSVLRRCTQEVRIAARDKIQKLTKVPEHDAITFITRVSAAIEANSQLEEVPEGALADLCVVVSAASEGRPTAGTTALNRAVKNLTTIFSPLRAPPRKPDETEEVELKVGMTVAKRDACLSILCHPEVMSSMWEKLFVQSARSPSTSVGQKGDVNGSLRNCLCMLLSLASVHLCSKSVAEDAEVQEMSIRAAEEGAVQEMRDARKEEDVLTECVGVCEEVHPWCWWKSFESKSRNSKHTRREVLMACIQQSVVVGRGIVLWAREGLLNKPDSTKIKKSAIFYLELLELVAERYPVLCQDVIDVYADAYAYQLWSKMDVQREPAAEQRLRKLFGNALVSMLRLRHGTTVLTLYRTRFVDDSNIEMVSLRAFMTDVLEVVTAPYSDAFARALLALLSSPRMLRAFRNEKSARRPDGSTNRVKTLVAEACTAVRMSNPGVDSDLVARTLAAYCSM